MIVYIVYRVNEDSTDNYNYRDTSILKVFKYEKRADEERHKLRKKDKDRVNNYYVTSLTLSVAKPTKGYEFI